MRFRWIVIFGLVVAALLELAFYNVELAAAFGVIALGLAVEDWSRGRSFNDPASD